MFWGTIVAIPQLVPMLFMNSVTGALIAAVPIGLMGGVATAAYLDLIIRSSPRGLEGTTLMMSVALNWSPYGSEMFWEQPFTTTTAASPHA